MSPSPAEEQPPRVVRIWLPVMVRLVFLAVGASLLFSGQSAEQVGAGLVLMLTAAGHAAPNWMRAAAASKSER